MRIDSRQNPTIKRLLELHAAKGRREQGRFLIDTPRDIQRAVAAGVKILGAYLGRDFPFEPALLKELEQKRIPIVELGRVAFEAIAYRENPGGLVVEAQSWETPLAGLSLKKAPQRVVLAEDIEKPGNLGVLLRTADAVGAQAVIGCNETVELFNPNTLRASAGAAFVVPYATATRTQVLAWIKAQGLRLVATAPAAKKNLWQTDLSMPLVLAVGGEANGLSQELLEAADEVLALPMAGMGDSLNVSVACGATLYEVWRQQEPGRSK